MTGLQRVGLYVMLLPMFVMLLAVSQGVPEATHGHAGWLMCLFIWGSAMFCLPYWRKK